MGAILNDLVETEAERRAGVALDVIAVDRQRWARSNRRPPSLTCRDALVALEFEALLVWTAAMNLAHGVHLTDQDRDRLTLACRRIGAIRQEAAR